MNRSIQAEGAYGGIKWNRAYTRARRIGLDGLILEISMICCGFNLQKSDFSEKIILKFNPEDKKTTEAHFSGEPRFFRIVFLQPLCKLVELFRRRTPTQ